MARRTHYDVLAVPMHATTADIRRAYHGLARSHHPDRFTDPEEKRQAEARFTEMTEAFNVLSNPKRRSDYDRSLSQTAGAESTAEREAAAYYKLAGARLDGGDTAEAVRLLRAAVHLQPQEGKYHAQLARALEAASARGEAIRAWDEALRREPYNATYYREAGRCLEKAGMAIRARRMYENALKWNKSDTESAQALERLSPAEKKGGLLGGILKR